MSSHLISDCSDWHDFWFKPHVRRFWKQTPTLVDMTEKLRKICNNRDITYNPLSSFIPWERSILLQELWECFLIFNKLLKLRSFLNKNGKTYCTFFHCYLMVNISKPGINTQCTWNLKVQSFLYWNLFFVVQHRITYISLTVFYTVINNMPRRVKQCNRTWPCSCAKRSIIIIDFFFREKGEISNGLLRG